MIHPQVFVDLDGVLADFDAHHERVFGTRPCKTKDDVDWARVRAVVGFYADIPPMPDMRELWEFVGRLTPRPIVLTGIPASVAEAADNKRGRVRRHLGEHVEVRCCSSKDKSLHARPGDVLVDDWGKHRYLWVARGGRWVTHTSAKNSIDQLLEMGIGL